MPVIGKNELEKLYSTIYLYPIHLLALGEKRYRARQMARFVRKSAPAGSHRTLLEVGCMFGCLLEELRSEYAVKGIEIGAESVRCCQANGLDVNDVSLEDYLSSSTEKFDIIVLSHVLEHLLHPDDSLRRLRSRLNPGGRLIIAVPNHESICASLFGRYWGWWQVPVHINHFNRSAIEQLARRTGVEVKGTRFKGGDGLMLLLNFINLFRFKNDSKPPGTFQQLIIRLTTVLLRYWYVVGNEELTVVLTVSPNE
jgi:2-polyprenyl-3-methyl-5-hydroxy-6-metoxy-1,4-benzoquinol methylase